MIPLLKVSLFSHILLWQSRYVLSTVYGISLSEAMEQKLLKKLTAWVEQRVAAIMDGNHRNYYAECAAFIAALGEAQEALGESGAKDIVMEQYRSAYSRRSAFHKELRDFGMKDTRKKRR